MLSLGITSSLYSERPVVFAFSQASSGYILGLKYRQIIMIIIIINFSLYKTISKKVLGNHAIFCASFLYFLILLVCWKIFNTSHSYIASTKLCAVSSLSRCFMFYFLKGGGEAFWDKKGVQACLNLSVCVTTLFGRWCK